MVTRPGPRDALRYKGYSMHPSAKNNGRLFFGAYAPSFDSSSRARVIDIGSLDVNGSLRDECPPDFEYVGLDLVPGSGVDLVLDDPYTLPFADASVDVAVSSQCFEHAEMFWLSFLEVMRVLKPHGLLFLEVPSQGFVHRFSLDCWRFFPDSGLALVAWAKRNGIDAALLESFIQRGDWWRDFVGVFVKDQAFADRYPRRILDGRNDFENGRLFGVAEILNQHELDLSHLEETGAD